MKASFIKFRQISWKLTIFYSLIFSLVLILLNVATLYGVKFFLLQQAKTQIESSVRITKRTILDSQKEQINIIASEIQNEAQLNPEINVKIGDPQGKIVYDPNKFNIKDLNIDSNLGITRAIETGEKHYMLRNEQLKRDGKVIGYLQVSRMMDKEYGFIKLLFVFMVFADITGMIISVAAGYIMSQRVLRPIDKITKAAKKITVSDLNSRIEVGESDDELARLALTFNEMIHRLKLYLDKQNQFVSDASHELRTPIAVIVGNINLIDRWGKEDKEVLQESIQAIKNETFSMTALIERLLFLARSDSNVLQLQKGNMVLNELAEEVIRESSFIAPKHKVILEADNLVELNADRKMIKQLLRALVDNSIKFTPIDGMISIRINANNEEVKIDIEDNGMGIPDDEIHNIFDRFYRVDKARAKDTGGSGLGLSIVKQIVEMHDGKIFVESIVGIGTKINVILPL